MKSAYYIWMSMRGNKNSTLHFMTIFSIGLLIFFSTQMISSWIITFAEESIQGDVETNRTIKWQFEDNLKDNQITKERLLFSIKELQNHSEIEDVIYDENKLDSANVIVKNYRNLLSMGDYIQETYFGGTAVSGEYITNTNMIKGVMLSMTIIDRLTQIISFITYMILVSKYLEKRKKEMYRLWMMGCTDNKNMIFLFVETSTLLFIAYAVSCLLCLSVVSLIVFFFVSEAQSLGTVFKITLDVFLGLTPFLGAYMGMNFLSSLVSVKKWISQFGT